MPEGPEIRQAADEVGAVLVGRTLDDVQLLLPAISNHQRKLKGVSVTRVTTHGKAMLTQFSNGFTLYSHNQLYGVWYVVPRGTLPETNRQLRVGLHTREHSALLYSASEIDVLPTLELSQHSFLRKLGPDVLDENLDKQGVLAQLNAPAHRGRSLATLLLDQGFIAGLGNYLRSEILFDARVHPKAKPANLSNRERSRLAGAILRISRRSYRTGGITVPVSRAKKLQAGGGSYESSRFAVFARKGRPCPACRNKIRRDNLASRRLYWCDKCQVAGA